MPHILVVDDESPIRRLLKRYLEGAGHCCRTAQDVMSAKQLLGVHAFDLVISDITMPGESGIDLLRHVSINHPGTPLILVSVIDNPDEVREALEIGVYGYIVKPFTRNIVLINVENALRRHRLEKREKEHLHNLETAIAQRTAELNNQVSFVTMLMEAIPSPIFYKDRHGVFLGCNTALEAFLGRKREAIIGRTVYDLAPKAMADIYHQADQRLLEDKGRQVYEAVVPAADGVLHDVMFSKAVYRDDKGDLAGMIGVMLDITERKQMESALRASESKYRQIVDNIGIGVAVIGKDNRLLEMNRQMRGWFPGIEPGEETPCFQLFESGSKSRPCRGCPTMVAIDRGEVCEALIGNPEASGKRCFRIIASPIRDGEGKIAAAIELVEDVTEKLALEQELRQAQKLESIGQLAAGIAHEINTPIQYVGDNVRFLEDAFGDLNAAMAAHGRLCEAVKAGHVSAETIAEVETVLDEADLPYLTEEIPSAIAQSLEGIQRVSKIIKAMRQFSHPGSDRKVETDLNQALESTITISRNEWKYVADLETDFDVNLPAVPCFPGELNQVFLNLIINAAHAIGEKSEDGKKGKGLIRVGTRLVDGNIQIRIADSGSGIPASIHQRIFDPFFTTKPVGKGTGQGLAIAHTVITEKHGGTIHFDTRAGEGTDFIIHLPLGVVEPAATQTMNNESISGGPA
jgi:two-component system, NtrC family, sensor kinase